MIFSFFRKSTAGAPVDSVYRSIVAQSRQPRFYADWGVPDTVTGRFDMISLHLALVLRRLKSEPAGYAFGQRLAELFFRDMDRSLRELGVTDLGVPKKVRGMGNMFYGLAGALGAALDKADRTAVEAVLVKNLFGEAPAPGAVPLAAYLLAEAATLAARAVPDIIAGPEAAGAAA